MLPREIVSVPPHSLYVQSYRPREMQSGTVNADGYGMALWLDDANPEPAIYRTPAPIWADPNRHWMEERLPVRSLIAAVRSATEGIGYELTNVQPFARGRIAFAHNGYIEGFRSGAQRLIRESLGTEAYEGIAGSSDSEHLFALILDAQGTLHERLRQGLRRLESICQKLGRKAVATVVLGDGEELVAARWAHLTEPATLYAARFKGGFALASEPLDPKAEFFSIPPRRLASARGTELRLEEL